MSMSIRNNIFNLVIVSLFSWRQTKKATLQLLWSPWYLVLLFRNFNISMRSKNETLEK